MLGEADLQGAFLLEANLHGTNLSRANLREALMLGVSLQGAVLREANLQRANLVGAKLREANMRGANLHGAKLVSVDLRGATLWHANLQGADLRFADLRQTDLLDVEPRGLLGIKLYRAKLDHTLLKREQLGPAIGDEQTGEYREARDAYLALKQNFESLGDYEAASWAYIKERKMERACSAPWDARRFFGQEELGDMPQHKLPPSSPRVWWFFLRHAVKWIGDGTVDALCGYGESIGRVIGWMAFLLFIAGPLCFGILALLDWPDKNVEIFLALPVPQRYTYAYLQQLFYVFDAFTTTNFAQLQPANDFARLLSGIIALLGIFLTGLLGFVAGNRIRRS